jgi:subtilisin
MILSFQPGTASHVLSVLGNAAGLLPATVASHSDFASNPHAGFGHHAMVIDELGIVALSPLIADLSRLAPTAGIIRSIRPERIFRRPHTIIGPELEDVSTMYADFAVGTAKTSWALEVLGGDLTVSEGHGITVALLDTGVDVKHADIGSQILDAESFVSGCMPDVDNSGHGTHCAGLIVGAQTSQFGPRYGVAPASRLLVARIFGETDEAAEMDLARAVVWSVGQGAKIVSISAGRDGITGPDAADTQIGAFLRARGVLAVAAAGNESDRSNNIIQGTNAPANADGIVAAGAVTLNGRLWNRSNGREGPAAARVDFVAPGVAVPSARPGGGTQLASGTSVATPIVAGIAAARWSREPGLTVDKVAAGMISSARPVPGALPDAVGYGLARL